MPLLTGLAAKAALGAAGGALKSVPRFVWIALAVALAIYFAARWHAGKVEELKTTSFTAGYAAAVDAGKKANRKVERGSATITSKIRSNTDAKLSDSARRADTVRLRGPGAAACLNPRFPAGAGEYHAVPGNAGPAVAGVPAEERTDLIAMPFDEAVDRAETNDANRIEVGAWRQWHTELTAWWQKVRDAADKK